MYEYVWDAETGGPLLTNNQSKFSREPRPVYYRELDILGFDQYWNYPKDDRAPLMWAEANNYIYRGKTVAATKGGSLYTKPELLLVEQPEPDGVPLRFVDIDAMCRKNHELMEALAHETIQRIYDTYLQYQSKIDVFYVAFSGGKDSMVALDLVQRALPHDGFITVFGNTDMELPSTLDFILDVQQYCKEKSIPIHFYTTKSDFSALESWKIFGPPARRVRWCCTVHKTAPIINELCRINGLKKINSMMITGVRADESFSRSFYEPLSFGRKIWGQYSFHPILSWSSPEVYLYIYMRHLQLNQAYKLGFNRVGCIMCPNSSPRHEYIKRSWFQENVDQFSKIIVDTSSKDLSGDNARRFLETGAWKARLSGRELTIQADNRFSVELFPNKIVVSVRNLNDDWKLWYKTIGDLADRDPHYIMECDGEKRNCLLKRDGEISIFEIETSSKSRSSVQFLHFFKSVIIKSQYCIRCLSCVAECPHRNIEMDENGELHISDKCVKCRACLKIPNGCLYYNSIKGSNDMKTVTGVNKYQSVGVDLAWLKLYFMDGSDPGNNKTSSMFSFLSDAGVLIKRKKWTKLGELVKRLSLESDVAWGLMLCNLAYAAPFRWYIETIGFDAIYSDEQLAVDMPADTKTAKKAQGEFWNGFKVILGSNDVLQRMGFGTPEITEKATKSGIQKTLHSVTRHSWHDPIPEVILYGLYKFAEACGDYYQFTLETLLDDSIERDGVSPTRIFGLDRKTMVRILNGLSSSYPDFISASFTLDLDNITLREDKKAEDVLELFKGGDWK